MIAAVYASKSTDHLLADLARLSGERGDRE